LLLYSSHLALGVFQLAGHFYFINSASSSITQLVGIIFGHLSLSYWIGYLCFITEGKLAAIFIKPSLGVSNWPVIFTSSTNANKLSGTIITVPSRLLMRVFSVELRLSLLPWANVGPLKGPRSRWTGIPQYPEHRQ
jgi:hypothetical protein